MSDPKPAKPPKPSRSLLDGRPSQRVNQNGRETQERILASAERLFAQRGLDAVSTRDITVAAGVNAASIHYHFGTRQGLIVALIERLGRRLGEQRDRALDELEASAEVTLRSLIEVLVRSTAELSVDPDGRHHAGFIVAVTNQGEYMPAVREVFDRYTRRYLDVLARVTPHLDAETRLFRYGVLRDVVNRVVGLPDGALQRWIAPPGAQARDVIDERVVSEITSIGIAMFEAPVTR